MRHYSAELKIIRMDFVLAPYLLDFAGVHFSKPDFSDDVMAHWHEQIELNYGSNASIIYSAYHSLERYGIYYLDFRPSNVNLKGHPEYVEPKNDNDDG